jgi:glycosyltransferase involved in cell wall biosynthesis
LQRAGIDVEKISVVPLPYQAEGAATVERRYPAAFTPDRPLRVLFVGSVAAFKGVPSLLESLDHLGDAPIELRLVGPLAATIPRKFLDDRRVKIIGAVSRSDVMDHYRDADVLVFPSHSDGFGMAQVEAQGWRLPIIASRACGRVVQDGIDGLLLPEVTADAIATALRQVMQPGVLMKFSNQTAASGTSLDAFGDALSEMRPRG